jgi:large subunit ribosomal protein L6
MSRKGKLPISIPKGVEVKISGSEVTVKGPKGTLHQQVDPAVILKLDGDKLTVSLDEKDLQEKGELHGLFWALLQNMVNGTAKGFEKVLEMVGVGYRANVQGKALDLQIGFSHPTKIPIPEGLQVTIEKNNTVIIIKGADRQMVGQFAATVRAKRPPEPYQGKGIRYSGEYVRKKAGKSAAKK